MSSYSSRPSSLFLYLVFILPSDVTDFKSHFITEQNLRQKNRELIFLQLVRCDTLHFDRWAQNLLPLFSEYNNEWFLYPRGLRRRIALERTTTLSNFTAARCKTAIFIIQSRKNLISQLTAFAFVETSICRDWCRIVVLLLRNMILQVTVACTHL